MRILVCTEQFLPMIGGIEIFLSLLLPALRARGCEPLLLTDRTDRSLPEESSHEGVPVIRLPMRSALQNGDGAMILELHERIGRIKSDFAPQLLHIHGLMPSAVFHLPKKASTPMLLTLHGSITRIPVGPQTLSRRLLLSADWITGVSRSVLAEAVEKFSNLARLSSVITNALPIPENEPRPLPWDPPTILFIGRLVDEKRPDLALEAFVAVRENFPTARLLIAGDGENRQILVERIRSLGLSEAVEMMDWVAPAQVARVINRATVVVLPSETEGFGLVALEAAQMGRPVIASDVGGFAEIVDDGETGLLIEAGSLPALTTALGGLLADRVAARRLGAAAHRRAARVYGWEKTVDAYYRLYKNLIDTAAG
jgi:glycogen(starch) synthase